MESVQIPMQLLFPVDFPNHSTAHGQGQGPPPGAQVQVHHVPVSVSVSQSGPPLPHHSTCNGLPKEPEKLVTMTSAPGTVQVCLICSKIASPANGLPTSGPSVLACNGNDVSSPFSKSTYLLRNVLHFSQDQCQLLFPQRPPTGIPEEHASGSVPDSWIVLCEDCGDSVGNAFELHAQIITMQNQLSILQDEIQRKFKDRLEYESARRFHHVSPNRRPGEEAPPAGLNSVLFTTNPPVVVGYDTQAKTQPHVVTENGHWERTNSKVPEGAAAVVRPAVITNAKSQQELSASTTHPTPSTPAAPTQAPPGGSGMVTRSKTGSCPKIRPFKHSYNGDDSDDDLKIQCKLCKRYYDKAIFRAHMEDHIKYVATSCGICNYVAKSQQKLVKHCRRKHKELYPTNNLFRDS